MPITVELQDMHSYSVIMIVIEIAFVAISMVFALIVLLKRNKKEIVVAKKEIPVENRAIIKQKYLGLLNKLEIKCRDNKLSNRKAYQELSKIARHFVHEVTGIKVHNLTLQEIKNVEMSGLSSVVSECYVPEFSIDKNGDIYSSITKAKKVIEEWN